MRYLILLLLLVSCSSERILSHRRASVGLSHPAPREIDTSIVQRPLLKVEHRGDSVYLVETERVDGEDIASIKAATVKVVGGIKNLAERNGKVYVSFNVIVPKIILGDERMVVLSPVLHKELDSILFNPLSIRGVTMNELQEREGWQMNLYIKRFKKSVEDSYRRFIRFPTLIETRLDSIIAKPNEMTYFYSQELPSTTISKRMFLTVPGNVYSIDGSVYNIPPRDTVRYLVSSMLSFADTSTKYLTRIIDKYVSLSRRFNVTFKAGSASVDPDDNEVKEMTDFFSSLKKSEDFAVDSIILTASSSPDGSYALNFRLSSQRAQALSQIIKPNRTIPIAENWPELKDSINSSKLIHKPQIMEIINQTKDDDQRELLIRTKYPKEYRLIKETYYPSLRYVSMKCFLRRKGMEKDTIHLQEVDSVYMNALAMLNNRNYAKSLETLSNYNDRNTAIALMSLGYNEEALKIIQKEPVTDQREYLLAILYSRLDNIQEGLKHYLESCRLNRRMEFRGNLDPEINKLLQK